MLKKLDAVGAYIYAEAICFFQGLKEDESGLSGVVVAVLLILVAVLAVTLLWSNLEKWLDDMWLNITGKASSIA